MGQKFDIAVTPDRTKARITIYSSNTSLEDIKTEIRNSKIVEGLRWHRLQEALLTLQNSAGDSIGIIFAEVDKPGPLLHFGDREIDPSKEDFRKLKNDLGVLYRRLASSQPFDELPACMFAAKGEVFFRELSRCEFRDVYGAITTVAVTEKPLFRNTSTVDVQEKDGWFKFSATCDGYVAVTPRNELHILAPTVVSPDKMEMHFILAPTVPDKEALLDCLYESAKTKDGRIAVSLPEREQAGALFESGRVARILIRKGISPRRGNDARLLFRVNVEKRPCEEDSQINLRAFSKIYEIGEGALIAEKTPAIPGVAGLNIFNEPVMAAPVRDILFRAGTNVREQREGTKILYVAALGGVLNLSDRGADISEVLQIKNDVGPETGDIHFSKKILINGDVLSGYRVQCGGDLTIKGSVENGAVILCEGNLSVSKGIHGHGTDLVVKGNAQIGFIQESKVKVDHDLTVQHSIFNSQVFCGGTLVVQGRGVDGQNRGCVIGGNIVAMKTMDLYSVGSIATGTKLFCGVNLELLTAVNAINTSISSLNKRITRLRSEIGIDLTSPDAAVELNKLPAAAKETVKKCLLELRNALGTQKELREKLSAVQEKVWAGEPEKCAITVRNHLFPDVDIQICNALRRVKTDESNVLFSLIEDSITISKP